MLITEVQRERRLTGVAQDTMRSSFPIPPEVVLNVYSMHNFIIDVAVAARRNGNMSYFDRPGLIPRV